MIVELLALAGSCEMWILLKLDIETTLSVIFACRHIVFGTAEGIKDGARVRMRCAKGTITSKIKHAIKQHKSCKTCTNVAALITGRYAVIGCKLKQNANEGWLGCNSCASLAGLVLSFIACFILLVIAP